MHIAQSNYVDGAIFGARGVARARARASEWANVREGLFYNGRTRGSLVRNV